MSNPTLGETLTRIRAHLNMNQENFGIFLGGFDTGTISVWELNKFCPTRANMSKVKEKLKPYLTPDELAVFDNQPVTKETA